MNRKQLATGISSLCLLGLSVYWVSSTRTREIQPEPSARASSGQKAVSVRQSRRTGTLPVPAARPKVTEEQPALPVMVPNYHPRPADEWQGMLVDLNDAPPCERSSDCAFALACREGKCGPCLGDSECSPGERCVLDRCVQSKQSSCRSRKDCSSGKLCLLTGLSDDVRGNLSMQSVCEDKLRVPQEPGGDRVASNQMDLGPSVAPESIEWKLMDQVAE